MSITRLQQARQMYALGKLVERVGFRRGGTGGGTGDAGSPGTNADGSNANTGGGGGGNNDRPTMADIAGPVSTTTNTTTNNNSKFDPFDHTRFDVGSGYYGEPVTSPDPDGTTINKFTNTFAPTVIKKTPLDYVKQLFSIASILTPHTLVGKIGLGLGTYNKAKTTLQTMSSIADTFGINTDSITNSLSNNFSGFGKGKKSTKNNTTNNGGGDGEGLASLNNQASGYDEYILLLQKLQSGNISDAERTKYTMLKNRLGI
tara:strand:+ start:18 stop:794 length:777 start_codon:yes stop_codon:yes gene_type:complete